METPSAIRLVLSGATAGEHVVSRSQPLLLGRAGRARVYDLGASRLHCRIELGEHGLELIDLGSTNGTFLNDRQVRRAPLADGDRVRIGEAEIRVHIRAEESDALLDRPFACCRCGCSISLATFADGEVAELAGRFLCPACASRSADGAAEAGHERIVDELEADGFTGLSPLPVPSAALLFKARRKALRQPVTLKVLETDGVAPARIERFLREARICVRLSHPAIVRVMDVRRTPGLIYMVLERIEGMTLLEEIEAHGRLDPRRALSVGLPVARALVYAHEEGVVHRDIKPANILVDADGAAKLIDFGLAKSLRKLGSRRLTREEEPLGTMAYAAPEQIADAGSVTEQADLFGFGATLYHALAGWPPFSDRWAALEGRPEALPPLREVAPNVPEGLAAIVERCMQPRPADRFAGARQLLVALEDAICEIYGFPAGGADPGVLVHVAPADVMGEDTRRMLQRFAGDGERGSVFFGRFTSAELVELAQLVETNSKSGVLEVRSDAGEGEVLFRDGKAARARFAGKQGKKALLRIFAQESGHFRLIVRPVDEPADHLLALSPILLEVMRRRDESQRLPRAGQP